MDDHHRWSTSIGDGATVVMDGQRLHRMVSIKNTGNDNGNGHGASKWPYKTPMANNETSPSSFGNIDRKTEIRRQFANNTDNTMDNAAQHKIKSMKKLLSSSNSFSHKNLPSKLFLVNNNNNNNNCDNNDEIYPHHESMIDDYIAGNHIHHYLVKSVSTDSGSGTRNRRPCRRCNSMAASSDVGGDSFKNRTRINIIRKRQQRQDCPIFDDDSCDEDLGDQQEILRSEDDQEQKNDNRFYLQSSDESDPTPPPLPTRPPPSSSSSAVFVSPSSVEEEEDLNSTGSAICSDSMNNSIVLDHKDFNDDYDEDLGTLLTLHMLTMYKHRWFFNVNRQMAEEMLLTSTGDDSDCPISSGNFLVRPSVAHRKHLCLSVLIKANKINSERSESDLINSSQPLRRRIINSVMDDRLTKQHIGGHQWLTGHLLVKHILINPYRIQQTSRLCFFIQSDRIFSSVEQLVDYYRSHPIDGVDLILTNVPSGANFIWQRCGSFRNGNPSRRTSTSPIRTGMPLNMVQPTPNNQRLTNNSNGSNRSHQTNRLVDLKDKQWQIKTSELKLMEELGSGQFGVVRRGKWKGVYDVAVKLLKEGTMSEEAFLDEANIMTKLQHPNLVRLYGVCIEHRPLFIVAEYMKYGSLQTYLKNKEQEISQSRRCNHILLDMCHQIANGMAYLERNNYIHRDLSARNCLVGNKNVVKVADFGLTRYVRDNEYTSKTGTKFPIRWASPEVLLYTRFSSKSDVWAFGILVWEVFSYGRTPYARWTNSQVMNKIADGYRLPKPKNSPIEVYEQIMKMCWRDEPDQRPSFTGLLLLIDIIDENLLTKPIEPDKDTGH